MSPLLRSLVAAASFSLFAASSMTANAATETEKTIEAFIDQTEILYLSRPAGSLIIGNPSVATVAVHDDRTLLITGKSFGATNLIVLDQIGRPIQSAQIKVGENRAGDTLTISRGANVQTLSCTTRCRPVKTNIE